MSLRRVFSNKKSMIALSIVIFVLFIFVTLLFFRFGKKSRDWNDVELYIRPSQPINTRNWVVMTSIGKPDMPAIKKLFSLKNWEFVNVGDTKTPDWNEFDLPPNVHYLSVEDQEKMDYRILEHIPYKHYGRKNIGYLYAIERGAQVIYETDDDTILVEDTLNFIPEWESPELETIASSIGIANVYSFFQDLEKGDHYVWPRGIPLQSLAEVKKDGVVSKCKKRKLFTPVQQYLQDIDPDVDAIYRLTHSEIITKKEGTKPFRFRKRKEMIGLEAGVFSPYNTQNTITTYSAFWGLLLPVNVNFRVTDIWRGYWAQRMLWEIGGRLTFGSSTCDHIRNPHDYFLDFVDEEPLYSDSQRFVDLLRNWRRGKGMSLFDAIMDLSQKMAEEGIWGDGDHLLMEAFLLDLIDIGYRPSPVVDVFFEDDGNVKC